MKNKFKQTEHSKLPHLGTWEVAQRPELSLGAIMKDGRAPILTVIVHEESYFIFAAHVSPHDAKDIGATAMMKAVDQHQFLPEMLHVRDRKLFDELEPLAKELGFSIKQVHKLKAVPQIFREMTYFFNEVNIK